MTSLCITITSVIILICASFVSISFAVESSVEVLSEWLVKLFLIPAGPIHVHFTTEELDSRTFLYGVFSILVSVEGDKDEVLVFALLDVGSEPHWPKSFKVGLYIDFFDACIQVSHIQRILVVVVLLEASSSR